VPIIRSGRINYIFKLLYEFYGATVEIDKSIGGSWGDTVSEYAVAYKLGPIELFFLGGLTLPDSAWRNLKMLKPSYAVLSDAVQGLT
jgi:hypothetical protein